MALRLICQDFKEGQATQEQIDILDMLGKDTNLAGIRSARAEIRAGLGAKQLGPIQRMTLLSTVSYNELNQILKRKVVNINDLTITDYQRVLLVKNNPERLYLKIVNHPIKILPSFEYGWQETPVCPNGRMYYLLSYNIMMIDIDDDVTGNGEREDTTRATTLSMIEDITIKLDLTVRVYKIYNGYHVFITSNTVEHRDVKVSELTKIFNGDIYYGVFSTRVGFKVRLNRKLNREDDIVGQYVTSFGTQ